MNLAFLVVLFCDVLSFLGGCTSVDSKFFNLSFKVVLLVLYATSKFLKFRLIGVILSPDLL